MDPKVMKVVDDLMTEIDANIAERKRTGAPWDADKAAMAAGPDTAGFLNLLIRSTNARSIVEVGTSFGYTILWLGEAAKATGGHVIGMEAIEIKRTRTQGNLVKAGLDDVVDVRLGDAKEIVEELDGPIDVAFIDAWKSDYPFYFDALLPKLRVGGCIVADNITYPESARESAEAYQAHVRAQPNVRSQLLTIGSGLEMSVRTG